MESLRTQVILNLNWDLQSAAKMGVKWRLSQGSQGWGQGTEVKGEDIWAWGRLGHVTSCPSLESTDSWVRKKITETLLSSGSCIPGPWRPKLVPARWLLALNTVPKTSQRSSLCLKESKPLGRPIHKPAENCTLSTPKNKPPSLQSVPLFLTPAGFLFTWLVLPALDSLSKRHPGLPSAFSPFSLGTWQCSQISWGLKLKEARCAEGWRPSGFQQEVSRVGEGRDLGRRGEHWGKEFSGSPEDAFLEAQPCCSCSPPRVLPAPRNTGPSSHSNSKTPGPGPSPGSGFLLHWLPDRHEHSQLPFCHNLAFSYHLRPWPENLLHPPSPSQMPPPSGTGPSPGGNMMSSYPLSPDTPSSGIRMSASWFSKLLWGCIKILSSPLYLPHQWLSGLKVLGPLSEVVELHYRPPGSYPNTQCHSPAPFLNKLPTSLLKKGSMCLWLNPSSSQLFCNFSLTSAHLLCNELPSQPDSGGFGISASYLVLDPAISSLISLWFLNSQIQDRVPPLDQDSSPLKIRKSSCSKLWKVLDNFRSGSNVRFPKCTALQGEALFEIGWNSVLRMEGLESLPPDRCYLSFFISPMRKPRSMLVKWFAQGLRRFREEPHP